MSPALPLLLPALALAVSLTACQTGRNAKTTDAPVLFYAPWASANSTGATGKHIFAAYTHTKEDATGLLRELAVDFGATGCSARFFRLYIGLPAPLDKDFVSERGLPGTMRVDDNPPLAITYQYKLMKGKNYALVYTSEELVNEAVRSQVSNGQMIGFTLTVDGKPYALRFTLRNLAPAMRAALQDCQDAASFNAPGKTPAPKPSAPGAPAKAPDDAKYFNE